MTYVYNSSLSALICHIKCAVGGIFQKFKLRCSTGSHRDVKDITRVRKEAEELEKATTFI